jgi:hypothetical protein
MLYGRYFYCRKQKCHLIKKPYQLLNFTSSIGVSQSKVLHVQSQQISQSHGFGCLYACLILRSWDWTLTVIQRWNISSNSHLPNYTALRHRWPSPPPFITASAFSSEYLTLLTSTIVCGFLVSMRSTRLHSASYIQLHHATDDLSYTYHMFYAMYTCYVHIFYPCPICGCAVWSVW